MAENVLTLAKDNGPVEVEVFVGQAHFGKYQLLLYDGEGRNEKRFGEGLTTDQVPDRLKLPGAVKSLKGRLVAWEIVIGAYQSGPGQAYSARVSFSQRGQPVPDGPFTYQGPLEGGAKVIFDCARIRVS